MLRFSPKIRLRNLSILKIQFRFCISEQTLYMNTLDLIFPKRCVGCGKLGKYFCHQCSSIIRIIEPNECICPMCGRPAMAGVTHPRCQTQYGLDGLISFFHYDGVVKNAIKAIKYRFVSNLASEFVALIHDATFSQTAIIPIPLHPARLRFRGFNQAEILGAQLAERLNIPLRSDILRRTKETGSQVEMISREDRLKNMKHVFSVQNSASFSIHDSILLFDDVFTTGATMREAANVLKRAGARFVWGVTMAR
jgi:ComF family protein